MKISVIIPTFNRADFIKRTIDSILGQSIKPNEIIIVDDGSTDDTKEICIPTHESGNEPSQLVPILTSEKQTGVNIKYIYQDNKGVSSARNKGINEASNDWIAFCDSDDIWHKEKLKKQILFHKLHPDILISHTDEIWKFNDKIIKKKAYQMKPSGYCFEDNLSSCKIGASTLLLHKSILDKVGLFDENLTACEDYDLWLRILLYYKLGFIDEELITKTAGHQGQLSFDTPMMDTFRIQALSKHLDSKYKEKTAQVLHKKLNILLKGAKKHNNLNILNNSYLKDLFNSLA